MMRYLFVLALGLIGAFRSEVAAQVVNPISFDFAGGPQGWSLEPGVTWEASGGHPGGHLRFSRQLATPGIILGPSSLFGDWTSLLSDGEIALDFQIDSFGLPGTSPYVQLSGPGGIIRGYIYAGQGTGAWPHFRVRLAASEWVVMSGTFAETMHNVTQVQFSMAASLPTTSITRMDNFTIRRRACIEIDAQAQSYTACLRGRAGYTVDAIGLGTLQYQWHRVGVGPMSDANQPTGSYVLGSTTRTLSFINTMQADAGDYQVVISTACGNLTSDTVHLGVCVADTRNGPSSTCDGGVTIEDLLFYLSNLRFGYLEADVDDGSAIGRPDGGVGIEDLLYFLGRYSAGC